MKKIYLFILTGLLCFTISQVGQAQPADLVLSSPESGTKLHQATNSITFAPGYSYTPNGGTLTAEIVQEPIPGDDLTNPIVVGQFNSDFQYTDSQNTNNFTDQYVGRPTNDVFYRFTLTREMLVIMTHCGSALSDTYMHLLDASGNLIVSNDDYGGDGSCSFQLHSFIQRQLSAGTYYVVSEGYSQNGVIQTNITGYSNEFDYPVQPSPYSPDPAPVGAVDGLFSVSGTGAATYSIPVDAPPGVGGMSPQLSVVYNSQSVNGVTGWGSNLAGISVINRIPKSIYFDGTAKALTYLGDEAYLLDGQRLIYTSGTPGQEGAIYYPESDPFTKVLVHGTYSGTTCNTWFEVISKDGIKYTYGNTSDSRQTFAGGKVASWYLNHVEDPLGNYMDYNYMISSYYLYLNSVVYGKNKNESSTLENRIEMSYESRPDPVFFVLETTKGGIYQRLAKITSKTGTSVFREYVLTYANSDLFSRLASVTEKNGAGESLKPTQLYWNYLAAFSQQCYLPTVNPAIVFPTVPFADQSFTSADLNGDGLADLISVFPIDIPMGGGTIRHTNYAYIYWASLDTNGNPQFLTGNYFDIGPTFSFSGWTEQKGGCTPIDFDGDGIQEIVIPHLSISELGNFVEFKFFNGALSTRAFGYSLQYSEEMPVYATGDFNNDGKGDIISIEKGNSNNRYPCMMAGFNQGTTLYQGSFNLTLPEKPEKMFASDFNNDGLTDVMVFYEGGYSIFWNQGYGISNQTLSDNKKTTGTTIENNRMVRMGDFDGDGLSDFILNGTDSSSNWYFALSNGNGTFSKFLACTLDEGFLLRDKDRLDCKVYDFDLDGKSDVVIHRAVYLIIPFSQTRTSWMRSTGTSLTLVAAASSDNRDDAYSKYLVTGDFNGDGKTELMNYGYNCYDGSSTTQTWRYYRNSGITAGSGMLASVTDGYGSTTSMTYSPLTGSIYTKGTGAQYPVIDLTPPVAAVKQVVYDNGVAGSMTENYSYAGAKVHLQGKGLLGFMSRTVNNITTSVSMETGTKSLNLTWFTPSETYSKTTVDGQTAETSVKYTFTDKGAKKYFAYPNMKVEKDLDSNVDTTTYQYNTTYGYLTDEKNGVWRQRYVPGHAIPELYPGRRLLSAPVDHCCSETYGRQPGVQSKHIAHLQYDQRLSRHESGKPGYQPGADCGIYRL
ncbi:MAG: FG-GAP-like repeat-containing protein [Mangrovibacterium sp.]